DASIATASILPGARPVRRLVQRAGPVRTRTRRSCACTRAVSRRSASAVALGRPFVVVVMAGRAACWERPGVRPWVHHGADQWEAAMSEHQVHAVDRTKANMAAKGTHATLTAVLALAVLAASTAAQVPPRPTPHELTLVLEIGSDLADEDAAFYRIADLAVGGAGELYVLDSGNKQVMVFDSTGRRLTAFGREGGGPGEFIRPIRIAVDSVVRVFDAGQYRVSVFARDGSHLETVRLPGIPGHNVTALHRLRVDHALATTTARFTRGPDSDPHVTLLAVRLPSTVVDTLARHRSSAALWHKRDAQAPWGLVVTELGQGGAWALAGDSLLAIADGYAGTVSFFSVSEAGFDRVAEVRLPDRGRPPTEAEMRAIVRAAA